MLSRPLLLVFVLGPLLVATACLASARPCYSPEEAAEHPGKEICLQAHIYDVVESRDGTRYLDVCKPDVPDEACRFTIVSLASDRKEVGELAQLREQDVHLRGTVEALRGQSLMLLSHARQLNDGPAKFRPNPQLLSGFQAGTEATAFHDPALSAHHRKAASAFNGAAAAR